MADLKNLVGIIDPEKYVSIRMVTHTGCSNSYGTMTETHHGTLLAVANVDVIASEGRHETMNGQYGWIPPVVKSELVLIFGEERDAEVQNLRDAASALRQRVLQLEEDRDDEKNQLKKKVDELQRALKVAGDKQMAAEHDRDKAIADRDAANLLTGSFRKANGESKVAEWAALENLEKVRRYVGEKTIREAFAAFEESPPKTEEKEKAAS